MGLTLNFTTVIFLFIYNVHRDYFILIYIVGMHLYHCGCLFNLELHVYKNKLNKSSALGSP